MARASGPLRRVISRGLSVEGTEVEVLECGHVVPVRQDLAGPTTAVRRRCWRCAKSPAPVLPLDLTGGASLTPGAVHTDGVPDVWPGDELQSTDGRRTLVSVVELCAGSVRCLMLGSGKTKQISHAALRSYRVVKRAQAQGEGGKGRL